MAKTETGKDTLDTLLVMTAAPRITEEVIDIRAKISEGGGHRDTIVVVPAEVATLHWTYGWGRGIACNRDDYTKKMVYDTTKVDCLQCLDIIRAADLRFERFKEAEKRRKANK